MDYDYDGPVRWDGREFEGLLEALEEARRASPESLLLVEVDEQNGGELFWGDPSAPHEMGFSEAHLIQASSWEAWSRLPGWTGGGPSAPHPVHILGGPYPLPEG